MNALESDFPFGSRWRSEGLDIHMLGLLINHADYTSLVCFFNTYFTAYFSGIRGHDYCSLAFSFASAILSPANCPKAPSLSSALSSLAAGSLA
jgi:hypothetical protein